jgi:hypothetical protein
MWNYINTYWIHFSRLKQTTGMMMIILGSPLIFFVRDTLRVAPNKPWFSAVVLALSLVMMVPSNLFQKMYKPNLPMTQLGWSFLAISLWFLTFYNSDLYMDSVREWGNYVFYLVFFILLLHVSNKVDNYVVPVVAVITFVGSLGLIYSILKNPNFVLGMRAAIFSGDGQEDVGNPHIFGRNGYAGVIASYLLFRYKGIHWKAFATLNMLLSFAVMVAAQTRGVFLAFGIAVVIHAFFHVRFSQIKQSIKASITPRNLVILGVVIFGIFWALTRNERIREIYFAYSGSITTQIERVWITFFEKGSQTSASYDTSAANRLSSVGLFVTFFNDYPLELMVGKGYRWFYLDVPILEVFIDCGIIAFIIYTALQLMFVWYSVQAIRQQNSLLSTFLGYMYWPFFVAMLTTGRPFDTIMWFPFLLMMRFMGLPALRSKSSDQPSEAQIATS